MFQYFPDEMSTKFRKAREARRSEGFRNNAPGEVNVDDYGSRRALICDTLAPVGAQ